MKNYFDGGEAILEALRVLNVENIFSSPGSDWNALWEALARQKVSGTPGPKYISCGHETLAVNMAHGFTHYSGRMQAVVLHAGVGLLQGSIAIDCANRFNIPLIIFSSEALSYGEDPEFDPGQQWMSSLSIVGGPQRQIESLVKWAAPAVSSDTLFETIVRAGEIAQQTPAGPVYINVPIETLRHNWTPPHYKRISHRAPITQAPASEIERVATLLATASNPVIVTESIGRQAAGYETLVELAELLACPVVEPTVETANFPKNHPLYQGTTLGQFSENADVVIVLRSRVPWYPSKNRPKKATIVVIDEIPVRANMVYQNLGPDIVLAGDAIHALKSILEIVKAQKLDKGKIEMRRERYAGLHLQTIEERRKAEASPSGKKHLNIAWVCGQLRQHLPSDTIMVDETMGFRPIAQKHVDHHGPQSFLRVGGGLGQGIGFALGFRQAAPDKFVTLLFGDGAFLYNPMTQALAFAKHANVPVLVIVLNNSAYSSMGREHRKYYPDGTAVEHDIFYGNEITGFDYSEFAAPFGALGLRVEKAEELAVAMTQAIAAVRDGRCAILNILVE